MIKAVIFEGKIDDILLTEIILAMKQVKNLQSICALEKSISPIKKQNNILISIHHFCVLGSTVYVLLHKKKRTQKLAK